MRVSCLFVSAVALIPVFAPAQFDSGAGAAPKAPVGSVERLLEPLVFRNVGPSVFGGRILDIEVHPKHINTIFAAAATGGIFKTVNNGTTWTPIFDQYGAVSIGDIAISQSNPDILYVGSGENTSTRSAHYGDGVYKSTDGGKTWVNVGLKDSRRIGQVQIDPKNPDIVYVASMGYLYKGGGEKGIYKTTDGGKTWTQVLKSDNDTTGFIDVQMDSKNPKVLYAASHDRLRRAWNIRENGVGAAIYKTTDAGKSWKRLEGGLPKGENVGRIGLAVYPKDPKQIYAFFDMKGQGGGGQIWRTKDGGNSWVKTNDTRLSGGSYYSRVFVDPSNPEIVYAPNLNLMRSKDGGKTFENLGSRAHVDWHTVWVNPNDSDHVRAASDGGLYYTYDAWATTWHINNLPISQFYAISADSSTPYYVMGGTQDNGSWRGLSQTPNRGGIFNWHWEAILGGDGFYNVP
ncbi:MAG: glycosyl hydrolase, partial [Chlorobia bacterium]|nr:glycosyl hydrolase [Fimbriimonadaceae bacterium]